VIRIPNIAWKVKNLVLQFFFNLMGDLKQLGASVFRTTWTELSATSLKYSGWRQTIPEPRKFTG
jgi:hypothetical protein